METYFINQLKPLLDVLAENMELYVPEKQEGYYTYKKYTSDSNDVINFNDIRTCTPIKEFLFPQLERAATFPKPLAPEKAKPFAVFGLKECDLRSIEILDKVFCEKDFEDPFYITKRKNMFIVSSDCIKPGESCFCNLFDGQGFLKKGFDLNIAKIADGFVIEIGSDKGRDFIINHEKLFSHTSDVQLAKVEENRAFSAKILEENEAKIQLDTPVNETVENHQDSEVFDIEAKNCIECQACTRICPTCHCFYLYDSQKGDYFEKMKMWDSCMRFSYAAVAGGANPNKVLGERLKHRFLHKFVYFLERYGIHMCVGCGRCIDADAGGMDLRIILKELDQEPKDQKKTVAK